MEQLVNDKKTIASINLIILKRYNKAERNNSHSKEWDQMKHAIQKVLKASQTKLNELEKKARKKAQQTISDPRSTQEQVTKAKQLIFDAQMYKARAAAMKARDLNTMEEDRCTKHHFQLNKARATATQIAMLQCQQTRSIHTTQEKIEETMNASWSQVFKERVTNEDAIKKILSYICKRLQEF